jgi:hypothetical protein
VFVGVRVGVSVEVGVLVTVAEAVAVIVRVELEEGEADTEPRLVGRRQVSPARMVPAIREAAMYASGGLRGI